MNEDRRLTRLVLLAQSGDRAALDAILREVQGPLSGYLARVCGDPHRAEDVLQDSFVQVCRKLPWLREPEVFRAWVFRIASRIALRRLRSDSDGRRYRAGLEDLGSIASPEAPEAPFPPEWIDRLPALIGALSPGSRAVLSLHYREQMSLDEVASVLDVPVGTVKSRLAYGLATLRRAFAQGTRTGSPEGADR
jgi:RNA polymerase sigma-70 factor (ECF subfamily)